MLTEIMSVPQLGDSFDGIQAGILSQSVRNDFQSLSESPETILLHAREATGVFHEFKTHFRLRGSATGDESAPLDEAADDTKGIVERSVSLVQDKFV